MTNYYDKEGNRKLPYVEDSTKGTSTIQPLNYKGDVIVQVWMDSRVLATLNSWLENIGNYPRSLSEVVRSPLQTLVEHLVDNEEVVLIDDTNEARDILSSRFRVNLNRGNRGLKNKLHNQVLSTQRDELAERMKRGKPTDADVPKRDKGNVVSKEDMNRMLEHINRLEEEDVERQKREAVERLRNEGTVIDKEE